VPRSAGIAAPVPPRQRAKERDLVGRKAAQLSVPDEIRRVSVVPVVRDVLADVVQQGGVLEYLPVAGTEIMQLLGRVEQFEREASDLARVLLGEAASPRQALHRRPPNRTRIVGPVGRIVVPDGVEQDAFAQRPLAHGHLVELAHLHGRGQEHRTGDEKRLPQLVALLRVADGLDRSRSQAVDAIDVRVGPSLVMIRLSSDRDVELEQWGARRKRELFEKVFGRELELTAHPAGTRAALAAS